MPRHRLAQEEALRRIQLIEDALRAGHPPPHIPLRIGEHSAIRVGLDAAGVSASSSGEKVETMQARAGRLIDWSLWSGRPQPADKAGPPRFAPPILPAGDIDPEELIERLAKDYARRSEHKAAKKWMRFALKEDGPFALWFWGDPHLDDNGTNWPLIKRDVELARSEHVHSICMGDVTNNWAGKLQHLYAEQQVTRTQAWKLAEWFFRAVPWIVLLKGNHDLWSAGSDPLDWIARGPAALADWQAQFVVATPDGHEVRIDARHDFKGHSMWNDAHGMMRQQRFGAGEADIYAAGHRHNWMLVAGEDPEKGSRPHWLLRARGYKHLDDYADRHQFAQQRYGSSIVAVIDPSRDGPARAQCYADPVEALEVLEFKRQRWSKIDGQAASIRRPGLGRGRVAYGRNDGGQHS